MKKTKDDFERFLAELNSDADVLRDNLEVNQKAWKRIQQGQMDELDWAALGYTIHNLYGCIEGYCLRVSKFFENNLPDASWHRELLNRMTLEIPNVRPALFDREVMRLIDELRAFRHVFRNIYDGVLDPGKVRAVQEKVSPAIGAFQGAHDRYRKLIEQMKEGIDV